MPGAGVGAAYADVVKAAVVAHGDRSVLVDDVAADPPVGRIGADFGAAGVDLCGAALTGRTVGRGCPCAEWHVAR